MQVAISAKITAKMKASVFTNSNYLQIYLTMPKPDMQTVPWLKGKCLQFSGPFFPSEDFAKEVYILIIFNIQSILQSHINQFVEFLVHSEVYPCSHIPLTDL